MIAEATRSGSTDSSLFSGEDPAEIIEFIHDRGSVSTLEETSFRAYQRNTGQPGSRQRKASLVG